MPGRILNDDSLLCIRPGCDFTDGVSGVGAGKALDVVRLLIRRHGDDSVLSTLRRMLAERRSVREQA